MTDGPKFKTGDLVAVNRPDPDSGTSCILSSFAALKVLRVEPFLERPARVYLDTRAIPLLGKICFVYDNEIDLAAT